MADGHIAALIPASSRELTLEEGSAHVSMASITTPAAAKETVSGEPVEGGTVQAGEAEAGEVEGGEALDRLGMGISLSCAVHCIATGLISLAPAAFGFDGEGQLAWLELLEWPFLVGAAVVGVSSLLPSFRHHHERRPLALFGLGMVLLAASRFAEGPLEIGLTTLGVATIAGAHLFNLRVNLNLRACKH
jgi:hypothetical protein